MAYDDAMTLEDLQYTFETATSSDLYRLPVNLVVAYALHLTRAIPAHLWKPRDWLTVSGIVDQYRRTQDISGKQKWFLIRVIQETLPNGLLYL